MIIYTKEDATLIIPCGLGVSVCPDVSHDLQMKIVDSSTVLQQVEPDSGYYGLFRVIINPLTDGNLLPGNIRNGVQILGVMGTYAGELINLQDKTVNSSTATQQITSDAGYTGLGTVTVNAYTLDSKTVNPSVNDITVTPDHDGFSSVTVQGVTSSIDPDIRPENIKKDVEILGVTGNYEGAQILNQGKIVNSSTASQTVTFDSGYTGLSSVTVNPYTLDSKTVNSSTSSQTINSSADGLSSVTVNPYTVESKSQTITVNGQYSFAPTSADALSGVDIDVQVADIPAVVQTKSVLYSSNGNYTVSPDEGYDGLSSVAINVSVGTQANLQSKTVNSSTQNQTVTPDQGYDGLSQVTVNPYVAGPRELVKISPNIVYEAPNHYYAYPRYDIGQDALSHVIINMQDVTANSSTASQTIEPDIDNFGLHSVTINPYTVEALNDTISASGKYSYTPQNADALSSVDIEVSFLGQMKYVNPSINEIQVEPDQGIEGLSRVTVYGVTSSIDSNIQAGNIKDGVTILGVTGNYTGSAINNQNKTVNPSTNSQSITADSGYTGLGTVTVNPYTVETDSSTLTQNGTYTFTPATADALSSVTVNVSVNSSAGSDWYLAWKLGNKHDLSDVDLSQVMNSYQGACANMFATINNSSSPYATEAASAAKYITNLPVMNASVVHGYGMFDNAFSFATFTNTSQSGTGLEVSFPNVTNINGTHVFYRAFYNVKGDGIRKISFPELESLGSDTQGFAFGVFTEFFSSDNPAMLEEVYMPKFKTVYGGEQGASQFLNFVDDPSGASRKLTVHIDALQYRETTNANIVRYFGNSLTTLVVNGTATHNVYITSCPNISADSVLSVLQSLGTSGSGLSVNFASGLRVTDNAQGSIQTAYNTAVNNNGWTINNLTITPYS